MHDSMPEIHAFPKTNRLVVYVSTLVHNHSNHNDSNIRKCSG